MSILNKIFRFFKCLRCSTIVAILIYFIFIALILKYSIPPNRHSNSEHIIINSSKLQNSIKRTDLSKINIFKNSNNIHLPETLILGNSMDENILMKAFNSANTNNDDYLSIQELGKYINFKIREHTDRAIKMNPIEFSKVDQLSKDGLITWEEYHKFFLRERGLDENYIKDHSEVKHIKLDRKAKEEMMRDKARWYEAARTDPFSLTLDEYLAFRHPESSTVNLLSLVDDLLRLFDMDGDDHLTIDEFCDVTVDETDDKYRRSIISKTVEERRIEFKRIIDRNKDGKADRGELLLYVDPRNPRYALQEAATLINLTDSNKDGKLSLQEILKSSSIFLASKMIDTANSFHEEF